MRQVASLVYLEAPDDFEAVGQYYNEFEMTSREKVLEFMQLANSA